MAQTLRKEEEALVYALRQRATKACKEQQRAYAECVRGRILSVVRLPRRLGAPCGCV